MSVHDWTRVDAGLFHAFHHRWIDALCDTLNGGALPSEYFALPEQRIKGPVPDVLALKLSALPDDGSTGRGGLAVAAAPLRIRTIRRREEHIYADKANRISVRHRHGHIVADIEIVSPGNKSAKATFKSFVETSAALIEQKVHLLVVDLFPPTQRDPHGIHKAIWDELEEADFDLPCEKSLVLASYDAGPPQVAYVETVAVGDVLLEMPLFLQPEVYVPAPLEATYQATWAVFPRAMKGLLEGERMPT